MVTTFDPGSFSLVVGDERIPLSQGIYIDDSR